MNWYVYAIAGSLMFSLAACIYLRRWMVMRAKADDALYRLVGNPVLDKHIQNARKLTNSSTRSVVSRVINKANRPERHDTEWPHNFENK